MASRVPPASRAATAAQTNPAAQSARLWRQQHERAIVNELVTLLAVPNVSSDKANIQRNAELVAKMIQARGLAAKLRVGAGRQPGGRRADPHAGRDAHHRSLRALRRPAARPEGMGLAAVRADAAHAAARKRRHAGAASRRGLPVRSRIAPAARGAGDDKAPIVAMLTALDAIRSRRACG
mgnify:CR=1 FL=1